MKNVHIKIAIALGLFALIRPIIRIIADVNGTTITPIVVLTITAFVAAVWVITAVKRKIPHPVETLAAAGVVYAVSSIMLAIVIQTIFPEHKDPEASFAQLATAGLVATSIFNAIYGAVLGLIAKQFSHSAKKH